MRDLPVASYTVKDTYDDLIAENARLKDALSNLADAAGKAAQYCDPRKMNAALIVARELLK